jgi:hypothetical protein
VREGNCGLVPRSFLVSIALKGEVLRWIKNEKDYKKLIIIKNIISSFKVPY